MTPAGPWPRLAALAIDVAALAVLVAAASAVVVRLGGVEFDDGVIDPLAVARWWGQRHPGLLAAVPAAFAIAGWSTLGATPGQLLAGCRVVRVADGGLPGPLRSALRVVVGIVGAIPLGMGLARVAWARSRRGWHDYATGTVVVVEDESRMSLRELEALVR